MKVFHLIPDGVYAYGYINKINDLFNNNNHLFYVYGNQQQKQPPINAKNVLFNNQFISRYKLYQFIIRQIRLADKIVLHSLFLENDLLRLITLLQVVYGRKYCWWIWGGDLYNKYWASQELNKYSKEYIGTEVLRKILIRNMRLISAITLEDYKYAKEWYHTKAKYLYTFYNITFPNSIDTTIKHDGINILLGNSATEQNRHFNALNKLIFIKDKDIKLYCPLSYPRSAKLYIHHVKRHGYKLFLEKFHPITEFMAYDEYSQFLNSIDIAIFNNNRQQAGGNITILLYLGKKVYINEQNPFYRFWKSKNVKIFNFNKLNENDFFIPLTEEEKNINATIVKRVLSDKNFMNLWSKLFSS